MLNVLVKVTQISLINNIHKWKKNLINGISASSLSKCVQNFSEF